MADRFKNFKDLSKCYNADEHYFINCREITNSRVAIIAPHGGKIEQHTTNIANAIARENFSFYSFEGKLKRGNFSNLHITSHKFDEPKALGLVNRCRIAIGIHGKRNSGDPTTVWLGGLAEETNIQIHGSLIKAGFACKIVEKGALLSAAHPKNICNRGTSGKGVQLEIPWSLRQSLNNEEVLLQTFSDAVRVAIID